MIPAKLKEIKKEAKENGFNLNYSKSKQGDIALVILFKSKVNVNNMKYVANCIISAIDNSIEMIVLEGTMHSPVYKFKKISDLIKGLKMYKELSKDTKGQLSKCIVGNRDVPDSAAWNKFRDKFLIQIDWKLDKK